MHMACTAVLMLLLLQWLSCTTGCLPVWTSSCKVAVFNILLLLNSTTLSSTLSNLTVLTFNFSFCFFWTPCVISSGRLSSWLSSNFLVWIGCLLDGVTVDLATSPLLFIFTSSLNFNFSLIFSILLRCFCGAWFPCSLLSGGSVLGGAGAAAGVLSGLLWLCRIVVVFVAGLLTFECFFNQAPFKKGATLRREVPVDKSTYLICSPGRPSGPPELLW